MADKTGSFYFRKASPEDKAQVLAFTANTWEGHGDYIEWVYDEWVADESGCFLVAVDAATGKVAAIDKMRMLSNTEAWFEGIRVNPEFRGRGLSGILQRRMLDEATARGARTVRFLTAPDNLPIHAIAYRDGFDLRFSVKHWRWEANDETRSTDRPGSQRLRQAARDEAEILHDWWRRSGAAFATGGLLDKGWVFAETSAAEWEQWSSAGRIYVPDSLRIAEIAFPPPVFIVEPHDQEGAGASWHITLAAAASPADLSALAETALALAREHQVTEIDGLVPDMSAVQEAFAGAGFTLGAWSSFVLFEKAL